MRCRRAKKSLIADELGLLSEGRRSALRTHAESCPKCGEWLHNERKLVAALSALRVDPPLRIDVTARVTAGISALEIPRRDEAAPRALGWAAAAGLACGVGLLGGLWVLTPELSPIVTRAWTLLSGLGTALSGMLAPLSALVSATVNLLAGLLTSIGSVAAALRGLQPLLVAMIALSSVMMTTTIILVLGRDIRRPTWIEEDRQP